MTFKKYEHLNLLEWQRYIQLHTGKAIIKSVLSNKLIMVARYVYTILNPLENFREILAKKNL